jgi:ornithine cyclodeaminase
MSKLYTDRRESLFNEAEDFRIPKREGVLGDSHLVGEIGDLLLGRVIGRADAGEITLFKSLGLAVEDLAAAHRIYSKALQERLGEWVDFTGERYG